MPRPSPRREPGGSAPVRSPDPLVPPRTDAMNARILLAPLTLPLLFSSCIFHVGGSDGYRTEFVTSSSTKSPSAIAAENRKKMRSLEVGMSVEDVRQAMGEETWHASRSDISNPHREDSFPLSSGGRGEVLFYYTENATADGRIGADELTPVYFEDGALVGWGQTGFDAWKARVTGS